MRLLACFLLACASALLMFPSCSPPALSGPGEFEGCGCVDLWHACDEEGGCVVSGIDHSYCENDWCPAGYLSVGTGEVTVRIPAEIVAEKLERFPILSARVSADSDHDPLRIEISFDDGPAICADQVDVDCPVPADASVMVVRVRKSAHSQARDLYIDLKEAVCEGRPHAC